jgi:hypothetical protein
MFSRIPLEADDLDRARAVHDAAPGAPRRRPKD